MTKQTKTQTQERRTLVIFGNGISPSERETSYFGSLAEKLGMQVAYLALDRNKSNQQDLSVLERMSVAAFNHDQINLLNLRDYAGISKDTEVDCIPRDDDPVLVVFSDKKIVPRTQMNLLNKANVDWVFSEGKIYDQSAYETIQWLAEKRAEEKMWGDYSI